MSRTVIIYLAAVLVGFVACASGEGSCTTTNGIHRNCVNINKCKQNNVVSALRTSKDEESRAYLKSLFCGWEGATPKICCENGPVFANRGSSFDEQSRTPSLFSPEETCTTPRGTRGNCVIDYKCQGIVSGAKVLRGRARFVILELFRCGFEGDSIKLCCEDETVFANRGSSLDEESPSSPMKEDDDKSCTTPNGRHGNCINIKNCKQDNVVSALDDMLTLDNAYSQLEMDMYERHRADLKSLQCGWEETTPKICCENDTVL